MKMSGMMLAFRWSKRELNISMQRFVITAARNSSAKNDISVINYCLYVFTNLHAFFSAEHKIIIYQEPS